MTFLGEKKVPALLKAKVTAADTISLNLQKGMKDGYMVKSEFNHDLGSVTAKVFPSESVAKSYAHGQEVIKVKVTWVP